MPSVAWRRSQRAASTVWPGEYAIGRTFLRGDPDQPNKFEVVPEFRNEYKIVMRPDVGGMRMSQRGALDAFYTNDGHGHFTKVPLTGGRFLDAQGKPIADPAESFTLDAKFIDLNGDGAPDLYVSNDFEDVDELW